MTQGSGGRRKLPILLLFEPLAHFRDALAQEFPLYRGSPGEDVAAAADDRVQSVRAIVTNAALGVSNAMIAALPNLELIVNLGVGLDAVDLRYAKDRGIIVVNTPASSGDAVADFAMALLLALSRRLNYAQAFVREGKWGKAPFPAVKGLRGQVCGIAGMGKIGHAVALRAEAFGLKVAYTARSPKADLPWTFYADMAELAAASDHLVLALPAVPETERIVDARVLDALGPEGVLINVARGQVVDQPALIAALRDGGIQAAGLDVLDCEPQVPPELAALDNVIITPHMAGFTFETFEAIYQSGLDKLRAHAAGEPLSNRVT